MTTSSNLFKGISGKDAAEKLGVSLSLVEYWTKRGCPQLGGEKLVSFGSPKRFGAPTGIQYSEAQIEEIRHKRDKAKANAKKNRKVMTFAQQGRTFGFTRGQLYAWRDNGCCYLDGKKLSCIPKSRPVPNGRVRTIDTYSVAQLKAIHRKVTREQNGIFHDKDGTWLSAKAAKREYGLWQASLYDWHENGCLFLGGDKLRAKPFRRLNKQGGHGRRTRTCFVEDQLATIAAAQKSSPNAGYRDKQGEWFYATKVEELTGWRADNLWYYRNRTFSFLPAGKILTKPIPASNHPHPQTRCRDTAMGYFAPHIRAIVAHASGKPENAPKNLSPAQRAVVHDDTPARKRGRPKVTERHKTWKKEHEDGKSFTQIAMDNDVTRRAVVKALANLR